MDTKKAYLWVVDQHMFLHNSSTPQFTADLFFSSKKKFKEVCPFVTLTKLNQLVEVRVPKDFEDWDFCPDNY